MVRVPARVTMPLREFAEQARGWWDGSVYVTVKLDGTIEVHAFDSTLPGGDELLRYEDDKWEPYGFDDDGEGAECE